MFENSILKGIYKYRGKKTGESYTLKNFEIYILY